MIGAQINRNTGPSVRSQELVHEFRTLERDDDGWVAQCECSWTVRTDRYDTADNSLNRHLEDPQ